MSSHYNNQGLLTVTCFPNFTFSALALALALSWGLARASQPKVSGQGLRATFPKKRVGRASVKFNPRCEESKVGHGPGPGQSASGPFLKPFF